MLFFKLIKEIIMQNSVIMKIETVVVIYIGIYFIYNEM
jgi:hypothetical protein